MPNWTIDCPMFLRLTETSLGEYGVYLISQDGITDFRTPERLANMPWQLTPEESAVMVESIENARLDLPTTADRLLEWVNRQGGDFGLPAWFISAARAQDEAEAVRVLTEALEVVKRAILERRAGRKATTPRELRILGWEQSDLVAQINAIEGLLGQGQPEGEPERPRVGRMNSIRNDIVEAIRELGGNKDPETVRRKLMSYAGKPGSDLRIQDGRLGYLKQGRYRVLDVESIRKRIKRLPD